MDQDLVIRAQRGDRQAFEALTAGDYARLFRVAHAILRDRSLAEDATQLAYFNIWRHLGRLRSPANFEAWSYRIVVNACHAEAKHTPRWLPDTALTGMPEPYSGDAFDEILDRDELEAGFRRLNVDQRAVIVLHYLLDMTLDQVAVVLGVPKGTVDSRLHRALHSMRIALGAEGTAPSSQLGREATR